jgi:hypothetical protein
MAHKADPERVSFEDVAFRYSDYDTPLWARPNSSPGRWHEPADGPTQYLCKSVEGSWAELIRAENLRTEEEVALVRMPMWGLDVHSQNIADYSTFEVAERLGFPPDALIDDDHARCRAEGRRLRELGYRGVLAPSAALPGALNVTLFGPRIASKWGVPPVLASAIPATRLAVGAPPGGIVERVRHAGESHSGYDAYLLDRESRIAGEDADEADADPAA